MYTKMYPRNEGERMTQGKALEELVELLYERKVIDSLERKQILGRLWER